MLNAPRHPHHSCHPRLMRCPRWLGLGLGVLTSLAVSVGTALAQERVYGFVYSGRNICNSV